MLKKTPQFFLISMGKRGPSAQWISPRLFESTASLTIEKQVALSCFEGLSLDGGRADFS
jgi:hypothetical protein